jgi:predicted house-cleaning NTP pyrophosphatase (Maf/HAM1 superfamily)
MSDFIYLASQSPRRRQLLEQLGVRHELLLPDADEDAEAIEAVLPGEAPARYVQRVTGLKLDAAVQRLARRGLRLAPILCSDTTVALGRAIYGKPADAADARRMLRELSGSTHRVLTAVAVQHGRKRLSALSDSRVTFDAPCNSPEDILLINWSPQETRVAVVENGAVQELHVERTLERGLVGNVYLGKVARVLPGMQSAFIDIGLERAAFLHVADVWHRQPEGEPPQVWRAAASRPVPIERQVFEGQALMVQVIKDPIGTKGARLSTQISIAGRCWCFCRRTTMSACRRRSRPTSAKPCARALLQLVTQPEGGFILRTNGEDATDPELAEDIAYLRKTWARIRDAARGCRRPRCCTRT